MRIREYEKTFNYIYLFGFFILRIALGEYNFHWF